MGFCPKITRHQTLEKGKNYMFVANHLSMIDIMLMLMAVRNPFVFVGKRELEERKRTLIVFVGLASLTHEPAGASIGSILVKFRTPGTVLYHFFSGFALVDYTTGSLFTKVLPDGPPPRIYRNCSLSLLLQER